MRRLFFVLAIAVFASSTGPTRAAEPPAHLHVRLKPCDSLPTSGTLTGLYEFDREDAAGTFRKALTWNAGRDKTVDLNLDLPAGFYQYTIGINYFGDETHAPPPLCNYHGYVGLIGGHGRTIVDAMAAGEMELMSPLLLVGTLPPRYSASVVRYKSKIECGESTAGATTADVIHFATEEGAYYLYDVSDGNDVHFGLKVRSPGGQRVTFIVVASYPSFGFDGPPAHARYDITADLFERALAHTPAGNAVCIGTPTSE